LTSNKFLIKDLTGTSGRLDIIFRCILAAFSFGFDNISFHTVLHGLPHPPKSVEFVGNRLKELPIDEIRLARLFQRLLDPQHPASIKGIVVSNTSFLQVAENLSKEGALFLLKEGSPAFPQYLKDNIEGILDQSSLTFVLSDYTDLEQDEEQFFLKNLNATPISLGTQSHLASHCIIFLLLELQKYEKN